MGRSVWWTTSFGPGVVLLVFVFFSPGGFEAGVGGVEPFKPPASGVPQAP